MRVLEAAKFSTESLVSFALEQVRLAVVEGKGALISGDELVPGVVGKAEVELLRRIIYAFGGDGNIAITKSEAEVLFAINDATAGASNHPSWNDLFVKAIADFCDVLHRATRRRRARTRFATKPFWITPTRTSPVSLPAWCRVVVATC